MVGGSGEPECISPVSVQPITCIVGDAKSLVIVLVIDNVGT